MISTIEHRIRRFQEISNKNPKHIHQMYHILRELRIWYSYRQKYTWSKTRNYIKDWYVREYC